MASCDFCKIDPKEQLKSCVCGKASYCSKECQVKDWKVHKPFIIRESPGKGRGLFATRKIKEGQVILEEYPLFSRFKTKEGHYDYPHGETKAKILQLHDPADNLKTLDSKTVEKLVSKGMMFYNYKEAETDEMGKICRIICGNSKKICEVEDLYSDTTETGLYNNISLINHACVPNANKSWVLGDFKRHQVRALKTIEKDEEIVTSYLGYEEFVFGSRDFRSQELLETCGGFLCSCSECLLEEEDLRENDGMRAEIREYKEELGRLLRREGSDRVSKKDLKKAMKVSNQRVKLVQKLDVRAMFVHEMIEFYHAATKARMVGTSASDPDIYKQEAWKYAKICGDFYIHLVSKYIG